MDLMLFPIKPQHKMKILRVSDEYDNKSNSLFY